MVIVCEVRKLKGQNCAVSLKLPDTVRKIKHRLLQINLNVCSAHRNLFFYRYTRKF